MKTLSLYFAALVALAATSAGCAYATPSVDDDSSDPASAEQALAPHKPVCTKIGTAKEGWRWADTGALIRYADCDALTPQCEHIGSRSEGWYADGLIAWANCAQIARVHAIGEACGPSIGYGCDAAGAWCQGLPEEGTIGGSGTCQPFGFCADGSDCAEASNAWTHGQCRGLWGVRKRSVHVGFRRIATRQQTASTAIPAQESRPMVPRRTASAALLPPFPGIQ